MIEKHRQATLERLEGRGNGTVIEEALRRLEMSAGRESPLLPMPEFPDLGDLGELLPEIVVSAAPRNAGSNRGSNDPRTATSSLRVLKPRSVFYDSDSLTPTPTIPDPFIQQRLELGRANNARTVASRIDGRSHLAFDG